VTTVPGGPVPGLKLVTDNVTMKLEGLAAVPVCVATEIGADTAPFGTVVLICVGETIENPAAREPNFTLLAPQRYVPLIEITASVTPDDGLKELTVGATNGVTM